MTTYGTSHFVSRAAAVRYYQAYEDDADKAVEIKLQEKSIYIGPPPTKENESYILGSEGRYFIKEKI